jgi:Domain of unknown function (DUF1707)
MGVSHPTVAVRRPVGKNALNVTGRGGMVMDGHGEQVDPANLRVSHAEREHVLALLQEALSRGMLDSAEFDERAGRAQAARIRRDLNELVVDLPVRASGVAPVADSLVDSRDAIELSGWFSSLKRRGNWEVPRKLVLRPRMGSAELDFTEARIDHDVVEIELDLAGGSVELRCPTVPARRWTRWRSSAAVRRTTARTPTCTAARTSSSPAGCAGVRWRSEARAASCSAAADHPP